MHFLTGCKVTLISITLQGLFVRFTVLFFRYTLKHTNKTALLYVILWQKAFSEVFYL